MIFFFIKHQYTLRINLGIILLFSWYFYMIILFLFYIIIAHRKKGTDVGVLCTHGRRSCQEIVEEALGDDTDSPQGGRQGMVRW